MTVLSLINLSRALWLAMRLGPYAGVGLLAFLAVSLVARPASGGAERLVVEGTEFVLHLADGRSMRGEALVGTTFVLRTDDRDVAIEIEGLESETSPSGPVMLYRLATRDPVNGAARSLCNADAKGRRTGFPVPDERGGFALTCTSGAEAKCILMGYRPWEERADHVPMRELFRACIHLIRADYGGDNRPTTRDGTTIDIYDRFGLQSPIDPSMTFEAAWGVDGAVCVARPRIADNVTLQDLARRYPGLRNALGPGTCNDETARDYPGALLFNRSRASPTGSH
jgi:hypothetical protein